jgi:hypothetical protein
MLEMVKTKTAKHAVDPKSVHEFMKSLFAEDFHAQRVFSMATGVVGVFHGRIGAVRAARQRALDAAYFAHPERFPHGPPRVALPPVEVSINPITADVVTVAPTPSASVPATSHEHSPNHAAVRTTRAKRTSAARGEAAPITT